MDVRSKFEEFTCTCSSLLKGENAQFLALIKKRFDNCSESFRSSPEMVSLLDATATKMQADPKRIFVHLKDFVTELKAWGREGQAVTSRKRKAGNPLEAVAKMSKIEDSMSDGSDMEGKLQRALGLSPSPLSSATTQEKTTSPPAHSSVTPLADSSFVPVPSASGQFKSLPKETVPPILAAEEEAGAALNGCSPDSCTKEIRQNLSPVGNPAQGETLQKSQAAVDSFDLLSNTSGKTREENLDQKTNGSSFEALCNNKNNDECDAVFSSECVQDSLTCSKSETFQHDSELKVGSVQLKLPETVKASNHGNVGTSGSSDCRSSKTGTVTKTSGSRGNLLSKTVEKLKTRIGSSSLPSASPNHSPLGKTCEGVNINDVDDDDVIMIDDDSNEVPDVTSSNQHLAEKVARSIAVACSTAADTRLKVTGETSAGTEVKVEPGSSGTTDARTLVVPSASAEENVKRVGKDGRHVKRLEKLLEKLRDKIEQVREKELSLDDLEEEDSSYIYEDRLQKKFIKVWNKLCQLKGRNTSCGRHTEQRFRYKGSRYPEINRKVEKFVNRPDTFPDFHDIKGIVKKVNTRCKLGLSANQINEISRETFVDVGEALQKRRHEDFISTFHCKQTMTFSSDQDPALFDEELNRKLEENRRIGKSRLEEAENVSMVLKICFQVMSKYSRLQMEVGEEVQEGSQGSGAENSAKSEGEEEKQQSEVIPNLKPKEAPSTEIMEEKEDVMSAEENDHAIMIEMDVAEKSFLLDADGPDSIGGAEEPFTGNSSPGGDGKGLKSELPEEEYGSNAGKASSPNEGSGDKSLEKAAVSTELDRTASERDPQFLRTASQSESSVTGNSRTGSVTVSRDSTAQGDDMSSVSVHSSESDSLTTRKLLQSFPCVDILPVHKKSRSPVKVSTSLKLPKFLMQRNGAQLAPKPETLFYPGKMQSFTSAEADAIGITVIPSSDEETEYKPSVKTEPFIKTEPDLKQGKNRCDVIVLSDSD